MLKLIRKIKTNSLQPGEPKDPDDSTLFSWYQAFATPAEVEELRKEYLAGIGWGTVKDFLFEVINKEIKEPRARYEEWMAQPEKIEKVLEYGAERARNIAIPFMQNIRKKVGIGAV